MEQYQWRFTKDQKRVLGGRGAAVQVLFLSLGAPALVLPISAWQEMF